MSKPLGDLDKMPFGMHKGTLMQDVPASYLHYLWTNGMSKEPSHPIHVYIKERLTHLQQEYPDGIWT